MFVRCSIFFESFDTMPYKKAAKSKNEGGYFHLGSVFLFQVFYIVEQDLFNCSLIIKSSQKMFYSL